MNKEEILNAIKNLASSQGFYSRFYETLTNGSEQSNEYLNFLESQNFKDIVDLILFLEE